MKYYQIKDYGISLTQIDVLVWDLVNKVEKSLKRCKGEINFLEVFEATTVLAFFKKCLKSRFIIFGKSEITLYFSFVLEAKW